MVRAVKCIHVIRSYGLKNIGLDFLSIIKLAMYVAKHELLTLLLLDLIIWT